jgi:hypothetical protein
MYIIYIYYSHLYHFTLIEYNRYEGHLVHTDGTIAQINLCTEILFQNLPELRQVPFSLENCASILGKRSNLKVCYFCFVLFLFLNCSQSFQVDGSHHTGTKYDSLPDRAGVPWGACVNSSQG